MGLEVVGQIQLSNKMHERNVLAQNENTFFVKDL